MSGKTKFAIAAVMMFLITATVPAVLCLGYLAQNTQTHNCCPKPAPAKTVVPACCVQPPAVTSQTVAFALDMALVASIVPEALARTSGIQSALVADRDVSPPPCSSVLRI